MICTEIQEFAYHREAQDLHSTVLTDSERSAGIPLQGPMTVRNATLSRNQHAGGPASSLSEKALLDRTSWHVTGRNKIDV